MRKKIKQWFHSMASGAHNLHHQAKRQQRRLNLKQKKYSKQLEVDEEEGERITFTRSARFLMNEFGETSYWNTIWHLIWRPGYMISDFIEGKRKKYLQPFKILLGTTLMLGLILYIVPAEPSRYITFAQKIENGILPLTNEIVAELSPVVIKVAHFLDDYYLWNAEHGEFGLIARSILVVLFTWLLFRKSARKNSPYPPDKNGRLTYNISEILTAQLYIISLLQLISAVWVMLFGWFVPTLDFYPYVFPTWIAWIVVYIVYLQLFERSWYDTLWRTLLCVIWFL